MQIWTVFRAITFSCSRGVRLTAQQCSNKNAFLLCFFSPSRPPVWCMFISATWTYSSTFLWSAVSNTLQAIANTSSQNAVLGYVKTHLHAYRALAELAFVPHSGHGSAPCTPITSSVDKVKSAITRRTRLNAGKERKLFLISLLAAWIYTVNIHIYLIRDHTRWD